MLCICIRLYHINIYIYIYNYIIYFQQDQRICSCASLCLMLVLQHLDLHASSCTQIVSFLGDISDIRRSAPFETEPPLSDRLEVDWALAKTKATDPRKRCWLRSMSQCCAASAQREGSWRVPMPWTYQPSEGLNILFSNSQPRSQHWLWIQKGM